jgi:hypothetical protein
MITATATTDDLAIHVDFDATPYFEQASEEELLALADCGWGGDYPADDVAHFMEGSGDKQLDRLFTYLEIKNDFRSDDDDPTGFEVQIARGEALDWLTNFKPEVLAKINQRVNEDLDERLGVQAQRLDGITLPESQA